MGEEDRATMHSRGDGYNEALDDAVLGITLPPTGKHEYQNAYPRSAAPANALPNLDTQNTYPMRDLTPPVPGLSHSATPSSRFTDSPYSHVPTPSSACSYSSGIVVTTANDSKHASNSPLRPRPAPGVTSVVNNDLPRKALLPVRESSTSSSNSTVKAIQPKAESKLPAAPPTTVPSYSNKTATQGRTSTKERESSIPSHPSRNSVQIPPELAHLNVDAPLQPANAAHHPRRPSRDRTPSLTNVNDPSPVVQSDLPRLFTTYHKRTPSQDTAGSATSTSFRSRFGFSPRSSSKQGSPRVDSAFSPSPASKKQTRLPTPDSAASDRPRLLRKDSPAIDQSPAPAPSKSPRFSFLSRKSKGNFEKTTEKPKREARKGPVAGTGHEKYAKFGFRGRSGSTTSSQTFSRSPSADSSVSGAVKSAAGRKGSTTSDSGSEMDGFLRDRLNPVVLRGNRAVFGNETSIWASKGEESSSEPSVEHLPRPQLLPSAMTSGYDSSPARGSPVYQAERSHNRQRSSTGMPQTAQDANQLEPSRMSPQVSTDIPNRTSLIGPEQAERSGFTPIDSSVKPKASHEGKEGLWLRPLAKEKPLPKLKHKWNFFQRAQSSQLDREPTPAGNFVGTDASGKSYQDALHLGIFDAVEPVELAEMERIIQEHDTSTQDSLSRNKRHSRAHSSTSVRSNLWPSPANNSSRESSGSDAKKLSPSVMAAQILTESPELLQARAAISQHPRPVVRMAASSKSAPEIAKPAKHTPTALQIVATPELVHEAGETPETPQSVDTARQPRLSPVGRIPTVVSKRDRDRRLPDNSFSRPFANTQPRPTVRPPGSLYSQIRDIASPTDSGSQPNSSVSGRSDCISAANQSSINADQPSASTNRSSIDFYAGNDFIVFAPRKNSDFTYSSSSSGSNWVPSMPAHAMEDDIWNEYNDLMDDVMPEKTPISAGSSLGAPFQYANMLQDQHSPAMPAPLNVERPSSQLPKAALPVPPGAQYQDSLLVPAQRNSHLSHPPVSPMAPDEHAAVALAASQDDDRFTSRPVSPLTPDTLSHFVGTYGDRSATSSVMQNRLSLPQAQSSHLTPSASFSSRYSRASRHSRSLSLPEANARNSQISLAPSGRFNRDTQLLDIPEHDAEKTSTHADLRFGALMTSRWLSFGRILFSPAHNEVRLADEARILVVDGLGDDWSHYVATSYPNAVVYNLSISPATSSESSGWGPLTNYRHFNHASLSAPFPFPRGFFTAVVFRFPVAAAEHKYQACILESKRVLRPGGHLEVVALDIDMINMGTRGRRALRGLKTRMQQGDSDVSLGNLSDTLVRMIGRRGFEEVQRCVVGIPAAGRIPRSDDLRSSSCSSTSTGGRPYRSDSNATDKQDRDISFANLLQKNRHSQIVEPGRANDEGITKMVARVGRWWYSACYEQALLETDKSVWREHGLLRECEKQGTSFRLLICCAQKPLQARRRTKSV